MMMNFLKEICYVLQASLVTNMIRDNEMDDCSAIALITAIRVAMRQFILGKF